MFRYFEILMLRYLDINIIRDDVSGGGSHCAAVA